MKISKEILPYGTHIYREPSRPIAELKKDMRIIKGLGFNMVKIQESWAIDERKEGRIDLSKVEGLVKEARKHSLLVYFGVAMEQVPAWLWKKYPDCHLVYNTGETHNDPTQYVLPTDGKPGPCWDHPGAREAGENFIATLARQLGHYQNILAWNVWQEVGFSSMRPNMLGFCYCPYTLSRFRKWLKGKYATLEKLNSVWRTGYGKWDEIEPPRLYPSVPSWIDWRYFIDDIYLPSAIRWKVETFKKNDPQKRPAFCHIGAPIIGSGMEWRFTKEVDFYGSSCYPAGGGLGKWDKGYSKGEKSIFKEKSLKAEMWNAISLPFDYIRSASAGKEFWAAEFPGGPSVSFLRKDKVPTSEDIRRWVLTALSTGIKGLCFWNHRPEILWQEAYGYGLLDSKGNTSARAEEAGRLAKAINRHAGLFHHGKLPQREVAVLINEDLWHFSEASKLKEFSATQHLNHTIRGIYKMLWEFGIWVDFIESSEIKMSKLKGYKVVILPFPLATSDELMNKLKTYILQGGILVSEACPGRYDKYGLARPGEMSSIAGTFFAVEHKDVMLCGEPDEDYWTPRERSYGDILPSTKFSGTNLFKGHSILANLYVETFSLKGATPILTNGEETTGVVNSYGRGKAYLIGTFLGHSGATYEDKPTQRFLLKLLTDAGVKEDRCGKLLRRRRILNDKEAWFLINPTSNSISKDIDFKGFAKVDGLLENTIIKDKTIKAPPFSVTVLILRR